MFFRYWRVQRKFLSKKKNILDLKTPITVCGDIHGQFDDMLQIFRLGGLPPLTTYLFLGDYVDRGTNSLNVVLFLCGLKIKFPKSVFLLRGNHESFPICDTYGFRDEVLDKYSSEEVYSRFSPFNSLPLCAIISKTFFCVHGGLSSDFKELADIHHISRNSEVPDNGLFLDLLWADPVDYKGFSPSPRLVGNVFGPDVSLAFCNKFHFSTIIRAHEQQDAGYAYTHKNRVLTIFSSPNYFTGRASKGAFLKINQHNEIQIIQFGSVLK